MKFNAAGGASGEANNAAAALLAEVPPEDLLMAEWHNSIMRPCHYLALDRRRKRLVLSIRCVPAAPHTPQVGPQPTRFSPVEQVAHPA